MDLTDFVKDALLGVIKGVTEAQSDEALGKNIGPTFRFSMGNKTDVRGVFAHGSNNYSIVEFDIAVTSETTGGAKGGIKVLSFGSADIDAKHSSGSASRIKFSVPVLLPQIEGT